MYARIYTHVSFTKIYKRENIYVYTYIYMYICAYIPIMYIYRYIDDLYLNFVWKRVFYHSFIYMYICIRIYIHIYRACRKCLIEIFLSVSLSRKTRHTR